MSALHLKTDAGMDTGSWRLRATCGFTSGRSPQFHGIDRIAACTARAHDQECSREGQILFEVDQLVTVAKLGMEDECRRGTKYSKNECRDSRLPAQHDENPPAQLDGDGQRQDLPRDPERPHIGLRSLIGAELSQRLKNEEGGQ